MHDFQLAHAQIKHSREDTRINNASYLETDHRSITRVSQDNNYDT